MKKKYPELLRVTLSTVSSPHTTNILSGAFLFLFWLVFYWSIWRGDRYVGWDLINFNYPLDNYAFNVLIHEHTIPLWDHYSFNGVDFIGNIQTALFYPPKLILYGLLILFQKDLSYGIYQVFSLFHVYWFSVLIFLAANKISKSFWISLFLALQITYSGAIQAQVEHFWFIPSVIWVPLCFLGLWGCLINHKKKALLLYVFASVCMFLVGYPLQFITFQLVLLSTVLALSFVHYKDLIRAETLLAQLFYAGIMISGMVAIQLLPFLKVVAESSVDVKRGNFPLPSILTIFNPDCYGHLSGLKISGWEPTQTYYYNGLISILILIPVIGLILKRTKISVGLIGILLVEGLLAFLMVFTSCMDYLSKIISLSIYFRPWMMVIPMVIIVNCLFGVLLYYYYKNGKKEKLVSLFIISVSLFTLYLFNRPALFNTIKGSPDLADKNIRDLNNDLPFSKIIKDSPDYSILLDQTELWPTILSYRTRTLKIRTLNGLDPCVPRSYFKILKYGNIHSANVFSISPVEIPDFYWLADNGVKYFVGTRTRISNEIKMRYQIKEILSGPQFSVWELPNPRRLFSTVKDIDSIAYEIKANNIYVHYHASRDGGAIRTTMNYNSNWFVRDIEGPRIIPLGKSLGFDIVNLKEGSHTFKLHYSNRYFLCGCLISFVFLVLIVLHSMNILVLPGLF